MKKKFFSYTLTPDSIPWSYIQGFAIEKFCILRKISLFRVLLVFLDYFVFLAKKNTILVKINKYPLSKLHIKDYIFKI